MADTKFPVTNLTDAKPSENSFPKKKDQEHFDKAMNAPNNPSMSNDDLPENYNVTDDYCDEKHDYAHDEWAPGWGKHK